MDYDLFRKIARKLVTHPWQIAKTMPENPHWYTLRKNWHPDEFEWTFEAIKKYGYTEYFYSTPYKYFDVNGFQHWVMNEPAEKAILMNKAKLDYDCEYDKVAEKYDSLFGDEKSVWQEEKIISMLPKNRETLDIGCGTGLLIDYYLIDKDLYTGIDISKYMLNEFVKKHPAYKDRLIMTKFEEFYRGGFELITALFGAINYIEPKYLPWIEKKLAPGGEAFLMFYGADYQVKTHKEFGIEPKYHSVLDYDLSDYETKKFDDYIIARLKK